MKRVALVVGINRYPFLKGTAGKTLHLEKAATDAEAVAQLLQDYGDFEVHRLPTIEGKSLINPKGNVKTKELGEAILQLFHPTGGLIPETALFFFAGHGLQKQENGTSEGYLATSDTNPRKDKWGISLQWLRKLLSLSPVRQQLVWLDCCHSGELFNFIETDLAEYEKGRDRCFIAASREFESAIGGVLTPALLQGLNPTQASDGWVTNYTLKDAIEQALKDAPQHPILNNSGGQILLTGKQGVRGNICPYKGLAYFEQEDADYFYGRTDLTQQLLKSVDGNNFVAVLGASGSGKSSVVRAGLLYQLQRGETISGSERWKIYEPFTPSEHPLQSLEQVLG
ncbi:MAG: caspase family protein, partial [Halothece sp.]